MEQEWSVGYLVWWDMWRIDLCLALRLDRGELTEALTKAGLQPEQASALAADPTWDLCKALRL